MTTRTWTSPSKTPGRAYREPPGMKQEIGHEAIQKDSTTLLKTKLKSEKKNKSPMKGSTSSPQNSSQASTKKRKASILHNDGDIEDGKNIGRPDDKSSGRSSTPKRPRKNQEEKSPEKRMKRYRVKPAATYLQRLERVRSQRMFLIDRNRSLCDDGTHDQEVFDIAGSTGNVYQVTITKVPVCTCPDALKGNQCKHIVYVMVNVLKARQDLAYQLALLSTELNEIFANAPATPQSGSSDAPSIATDTGGVRKAVEGDCPICVMEFEEGDDIVWCKAACGNNVHRQCFEQWARTKPGTVKCVYCRSAWKGDEDTIKRVSKGGLGMVNDEGYLNVAAEFGLSTERDMSSYHPRWVNRQYGNAYHRY